MSKSGRIEGVSNEKAGLYYRLMRFGAVRSTGAETEPLKVLGHHSGIMTAAGLYHGVAERAKRVPAELKLLGTLKAAMLIGCHF